MAWVERLVTRTTQPQDACGVAPEFAGGPTIGNLGLWLPPNTTGLTATANGAPTSQPGLAGQSFNVTGVSVTGIGGRGFETGLIRAPSQLTFGLVFQSFDAPVSTTAFGGPFSSDHATINWHHNQAGYRGAFTLFASGAYPKVQFPETTANKLYSVIGTWNGSVMNLFINGRHIGQATATGALNGGNVARMRLMANSINGGFNGELYLAHTSDFALPFSKALELSANPWQIFEPEVQRVWIDDAASVTLPTLVQPSSTTSAGAWTATGAASLHEAINELVPSDTQYISVNSASTTELVLAASAHPGAANQTLAYRASSTQGSTLTVTLKQGATQIMTRTHSLTGIDMLYTQTLTAPEIALITAGAISVTLTTS